MCCYCILATTAGVLAIGAIQEDNFLQSQSGATVGLGELRHEEGGQMALEGSWALGGQLMEGCLVWSTICSIGGIIVMQCNMMDYNHRPAKSPIPRAS